MCKNIILVRVHRLYQTAREVDETNKMFKHSAWKGFKQESGSAAFPRIHPGRCVF